MTRRAVLGGMACAAAAPAQSESRPLIKPRALRPGDTIGLITPSTYVSDPDRLALVDRTIRYFGLTPKWGKSAGKRFASLRSSVKDRLDDLHAMFADREVNGIFAVRGGYGSEHLLDRIDYNLIRSNPKVFLGYSDITALHLAINRHAGLVTFHGPVAVSKFTDFTQKYFRKALFDPAPIGLVTNPPEANMLRPAHTLRTVRPGRARGTLIGGNLTLVSTTMGTPYEIETKGRILFIEDVGEETYRLDRMLTQLRLAGKLQSAAGIIWGECSDCGPSEFKPSMEWNFSVGETIDSILGDLQIPVLSGLVFGHTDDQVTLPEGVEATLDAGKQQLIIEESGVS